MSEFGALVAVRVAYQPPAAFRFPAGSSMPAAFRPVTEGPAVTATPGADGRCLLV